MQPNQLHQTIAGQIDNMKPDRFVPGVDVGMEVVDETTLAVKIIPLSREVTITYDEGWDMYEATVIDDDGVQQFAQICCDQLGEICFGSEAKEFSLPMVQFSADGGETWEQIA